MPVDGGYLALRVRRNAIPYIQAYGKCVLGDILAAFADLKKRADEIGDTEYARLGAEPADENFDGDMSRYQEAAEEKGQDFYYTMVALRQSTLNLFAVGLFHLVEQQLAHLCHDGAFHVDPPKDTNLGAVANWYSAHFGLDLRTLSIWPSIDELRLVANTVKHAEGDSAQKLREQRPELFEDPSVYRIFAAPQIQRPIHRRPIHYRPLSGDDLYVTVKVFEGFNEAATNLIEEVARHFEAHLVGVLSVSIDGPNQDFVLKLPESSRTRRPPTRSKPPHSRFSLIQ